jgi:hypothetical protein
VPHHWRETAATLPDARLPHWSEPQLAALPSVPAFHWSGASASPPIERLAQQGGSPAALHAERAPWREMTNHTPTEPLPEGSSPAAPPPTLVSPWSDATAHTPTEQLPRWGEPPAALPSAPTAHRHEPFLTPSDLWDQATLCQPRAVVDGSPAQASTNARSTQSYLPPPPPPLISAARPMRPLMNAPPPVGARVVQRGAALR